MEHAGHSESPARPDCFRKDEIETFQSFEGQTLAGVNYYLWLNTGPDAGAQPYRFLYAVELVFESGDALLMSGGDDSEAIRIVSAEAFIETASSLHALHGEPVIQRIVRDGQGLWKETTGRVLTAIRLTRHSSGLYRNDALLLDFGDTSVVVELVKEGEGLEICAH